MRVGAPSARQAGGRVPCRFCEAVSRRLRIARARCGTRVAGSRRWSRCSSSSSSFFSGEALMPRRPSRLFPFIHRISTCASLATCLLLPSDALPKEFPSFKLIFVKVRLIKNIDSLYLADTMSGMLLFPGGFKCYFRARASSPSEAGRFRGLSNVCIWVSQLILYKGSICSKIYSTSDKDVEYIPSPVKCYADTLSEFIFLCVQRGTTSTLTRNVFIEVSEPQADSKGYNLLQKYM